MAKHYYTREELIERERQKRAERLGLRNEFAEIPKQEPKQETKTQSTPHTIIKTRNGYAIKVDYFVSQENFASAISYSPEEREKQNAVVEQNRFKRVMLSNEQ